MNDSQTKRTDWPHSPPHWLDRAGNYIVTGATYLNVPYFNNAEKLKFLHNLLLEYAVKYEWTLHTWAVFPNHYHFVGASDNPSSLRTLVRHLHSVTAREVNKIDRAPGRKVWFNYWETHITHSESWFARVRYVNENAKHHGIVKYAKNYPFCSAGWLELKATPVFLNQLATYDISNLNIVDDY